LQTFALGIRIGRGRCNPITFRGTGSQLRPISLLRSSNPPILQGQRTIAILPLYCLHQAACRSAKPVCHREVWLSACCQRCYALLFLSSRKCSIVRSPTLESRSRFTVILIHTVHNTETDFCARYILHNIEHIFKSAQFGPRLMRSEYISVVHAIGRSIRAPSALPHALLCLPSSTALGTLSNHQTACSFSSMPLFFMDDSQLPFDLSTQHRASAFIASTLQ